MIRYQYLDDSYQLRHHFRFCHWDGYWQWDDAGIERWLIDRWGPPGDDNTRAFRYTHWSAYTSHMCVIIRDDIDAVEFKLRWYGDKIENPED